MLNKQCTSLLESVGDCSLTKFWDTDQSLQLSGINSHVPFLEKEPMMAGSMDCKCGKEMLDCSIHPNTSEEWTLFMQDSLVRTLARLESRPELERGPEVGFTEKCCELRTQYDQESCSWKTCQPSVLMDSALYSGTWPKWGMMQDGYVYEHLMSGQTISETGGSYLPDNETFFHTPNTRGLDGGSNGRKALRKRLLLQTPRSCSAMSATITENTASPQRQPNLETVVAREMKMWPTPTAHNAKEGGYPAEGVRNTPTLAYQAGGRLNPTWVEWLMGFPMSHTALKD